jgi:hypothetical protein
VGQRAALVQNKLDGENRLRKVAPVATFHFFAMFKPVSTSSSVIVGCSREWSIILARSRRETFRDVGRGVESAILDREAVHKG